MKRFPSTALTPLLGFVWGVFLELLITRFSGNLSGHPGMLMLWLPIIAAGIWLLTPTILARKLPFRRTVWVHIVLIVLTILAAGYGRYLYAIMPSEAVTVWEALIMDGLIISIFLFLPLATGIALLPYTGHPLALLGGGLAGVLSTALLIPFLPDIIMILIAALPAAAVFALAVPTPHVFDEHEPPPGNRGASFLLAGTSLAAGCLPLWIILIRTIDSISLHPAAAVTVVFLAGLAIGSLITGRLIKDRGSAVPALALAGGGAAIILGLTAARYLHAHGVLFSNNGNVYGIGTALLLCLLPGICFGLATPALPRAVTLLMALPAKRRPSVIFVSFLLPVCLPFILALWTIPIALAITGILAAACGMSYLLRTDGDFRIPLCVSTAIILLVVFIPLSGSRYVTLPMVYSASSVSLPFSEAEHMPDELDQRFRISQYEEHFGSWSARLENRSRLRHYRYADGQLIYPDEIIDDDMQAVFRLAALEVSSAGSVLYGGCLPIEDIEQLPRFFTGSITMAEEFPGQLASLANTHNRIINRGLRGVLNTARQQYDLIISIPSLPGSLRGTGRYTRECFQTARKTLTPQGVLLQYLPCYKTDPILFSRILKAFADVFSNQARIWVVDNYLILEGRLDYPPLAAETINRRFELLADTGIWKNPHDALAGFACTMQQLQPRIETVPPLHDDRPQHTLTGSDDGKPLYHNYEMVITAAQPFDAILDNPDSRAEIWLKHRKEYYRARLAWINGTIDQARQLIAQAASSNLDDPVIQDLERYFHYRIKTGLARSHHKKFQLEKAQQAFAEAELFQPLSAEDLAELGEIGSAQGQDAPWPLNTTRTRAALQYFGHSLLVHSPNTRALKGAFHSLLRLNLLEQAELVLARLIIDDPGFPPLPQMQRDLRSLKNQRTNPPGPDLDAIAAAAVENLIHAEKTTAVNSAAEELTTIGYSALPHLLQAWQQIENQETGIRIIRVITRLGGDPALAFARNILTSETEIPYQLECFDLIRLYGIGRDIPLLGRFLQAEYPDHIRTRTVITISGMRHPDSIPYLIQALHDPVEAIREEALNSLKSAHPLFKDIETGSLTPTLITKLKQDIQAIDPAELGWAPYPGETGPALPPEAETRPMTIPQAIVLGIIQGATEFLPISSSGHLAIANLMHIGGDDATVAFMVLLHGATLLAVLIGLKRDIKAALTSERSLILPILLATAVTAAIAIPLENYIDKSAQSAIIIGIGLIITSLMIVIGEWWIRRNPLGKTHITAGMGIIIGMLQGITPFPGISRSGTTISAGFLTGLSREKAVRFSFLLAIPAILGAIVFKIDEIALITNIPAAIAGCLAAFVSGYTALKLLLKIVQTRWYPVFALYTLVLALILFIGG